MFVLAKLKDTVRIAPDQFHMNLIEAISDELNKKLANKVLLNVGLCIALRDIVNLEDSLILPGDGASHTPVTFRFIVFRPAIGEIITGRIRSCSREGVHVTLGFFDDILIPPESLQHPSRFEEAEQAWVWEYPLEDGGKHDLFMDIGEPIKFRVSREIFEESSPIGPPKVESQQTQSAVGMSGGTSTVGTGPQAEIKTPYRIIVAINESGLGVLSWWDQQTQGELDEEEENGDDNAEYANDDDGEGACEE